MRFIWIVQHVFERGADTNAIRHTIRTNCVRSIWLCRQLSCLSSFCAVLVRNVHLFVRIYSIICSYLIWAMNYFHCVFFLSLPARPLSSPPPSPLHCPYLININSILVCTHRQSASSSFFVAPRAAPSPVSHFMFAMGWHTIMLQLNSSFFITIDIVYIIIYIWHL